MDLRPYICKQCGGQIDPATMRCRHCDTEYYDPHLRRVTISAVQPGEARLRAWSSIRLQESTLQVLRTSEKSSRAL